VQKRLERNLRRQISSGDEDSAMGNRSIAHGRFRVVSDEGVVAFIRNHSPV